MSRAGAGVDRGGVRRADRAPGILERRETMRGSGYGASGDDESNDVDHDLPDEVALATDAEVACPYCGETIVIPIDPGGGANQEYVEDCQVCCRPCRVRVVYDDAGTAEVCVEEMP
jgi:hypothetical protein